MELLVDSAAWTIHAVLRLRPVPGHPKRTVLRATVSRFPFPALVCTPRLTDRPMIGLGVGR